MATTLMTPVKEYMRRRRIRVVELAQRLGISRQFLSEIVNGWVSEETVRRWAPRIAETLGTSQHELFPSLEKMPHEGTQAAAPTGNGSASPEAGNPPPVPLRHHRRMGI